MTHLNHALDAVTVDRNVARLCADARHRAAKTDDFVLSTEKKKI